MAQADLTRARWQGGVEAFGGETGVEFGFLERGAASLDQGSERVLELVQRGASIAALLAASVSD